MSEYTVSFNFKIKKEKINETLLKKLFVKTRKFDLKDLSKGGYKKRLEFFLHPKHSKHHYVSPDSHGTGIDLDNPFEDQPYDIGLGVGPTDLKGFYLISLHSTNRTFLGKEDEELEYICDKFLEIAKTVYNAVHPDFGLNLHEITEEQLPVADYEKYVSGMNFYGPDLVKKIGKEKLLSAPARKVEELGDGGILVVCEYNPNFFRGEKCETVAKHIGLKALGDFVSEYERKMVEDDKKRLKKRAKNRGVLLKKLGLENDACPKCSSKWKGENTRDPTVYRPKEKGVVELHCKCGYLIKKMTKEEFQKLLGGSDAD